MVRGEEAWNHFQTCSKVDFLPEASSQDCHSDRRAPTPSAFPLLLVALYQPRGLDATTTLGLDKKHTAPFPREATDNFLTLFLRALFFLSDSRVNAGNASTFPLSMASWMMPQILGSSSWVQHRADAVMASMSPLCCSYSWIMSCFSSSEPLYFFSKSRMSCTVICEVHEERGGCQGKGEYITSELMMNQLKNNDVENTMCP